MKKRKRNAKCKQCGNGFRTARDWQIFCSIRCSQKFWNAHTHGLHSKKRSKPYPGRVIEFQAPPVPGLLTRLRYLFRPAALGAILIAGKAAETTLAALANAPAPKPVRVTVQEIVTKVVNIPDGEETRAVPDRIAELESKLRVARADAKEYLRRYDSLKEVNARHDREAKNSVSIERHDQQIAILRTEYEKRLQSRGLVGCSPGPDLGFLALGKGVRG
jgi:hypothetical protein